jgi:hypothetical protein
LLALGSGSKKRRRRVLTLDRWDASELRLSLVDASALYLALEAAVEFAGSDMNIEGALVLSDSLRLFGRGNGAARDGRVPVNATCDLPLGELLAYLAAPSDRPVPLLHSIVQYILGELDGLALGFTDAAKCGEIVLYSAAAEASKGSADDGEVRGSVLGLMPPSGDLRFAPIVGPQGELCRDKVEGVASVPDVPDCVYVVVDADDPRRPSELCTVRLDGDWR